MIDTIYHADKCSPMGIKSLKHNIKHLIAFCDQLCERMNRKQLNYLLNRIDFTRLKKNNKPKTGK